MRVPRFTRSEVESIRELSRLGVPTARIARDFGCAYGTVRRALEGSYIPKEDMLASVRETRALRNERMRDTTTMVEWRSAEVRRRLHAGQSVTSIARDLGVHRSTVHRWRAQLEDGGEVFEARRLGRPDGPSGPSSRTLLRREEAVQRRAAGQKYASIASDMSVTINTVFRWVAAHKREQSDD